MIQRSNQLRQACAIVLGLAWVGCGPGPMGPPETEAPPTGTPTADDQTSRSQFSVGLRFRSDQPKDSEEPRVSVAAVVWDAHGEQETYDLGDYPGRLQERTASGEELIRVLVGPPEQAQGAGGQQIRLVPTPTGLEARRRALGEPATEEVIERIPIPGDASVVPEQPAVRPRESERTPAADAGASAQPADGGSAGADAGP
jgi:hypothetical protein